MVNVYYDFDSHKWLDGETHKEIPHERWLTAASLWSVQPYTPIYLTAGLSSISNETSDFFRRIPDDYFERISEGLENKTTEIQKRNDSGKVPGYDSDSFVVIFST